MTVNRRQRWTALLFLRSLALLGGLRHVPILGGWVRCAAARWLPRDVLVWAQVRHGPASGVWLKLNPRTSRPYLQGAIEPEVQQMLARYLRVGMTVYDIGANIGFFSLLAARLVGARGCVVAFEADPAVAMRLREHVARNAFSNIVVEEKAVWSTTRAVPFVRSDPTVSPDLGLGHVESHPAAPGWISVAAVALDDYGGRARHPDFVKCDVEGAEVEVFRGARRLLSEARPVIVCELHGGENRRLLAEEFARQRYDHRSCGAHHVLALPR